MKKFLRDLTPLVMSVVFMVMYLAVYRHVIIFHEQHHLFLFSADYASATIHEYGLWRWLAEFVVQFAYWPWLGALLWTALLMGVYCMTRGAIRRLTGLHDRLQLSAVLPVVMFFNTVSVDVFPELSLKIFCGVAAVWLLSVAFGRFIPKKKARKPLSAKVCRSLTLAGPLIFGAFFAAGYANFYKERTVRLPSGKERVMTSDDMHQQRHIERLMIEADQAMRRADWAEVVRLADEVAETGRPNHLMSYFRAMALYNRGELLTRLFDLPQTFGLRSLFYPWKADRNQAEYGGYVYEQLGALNSAIHWEFEALVGWGETSSHLINLSRYYIQTGKPDVARKFIAPLHKTLFYRGEASRLDAMLAEGRVDGLRDALASAPQTPGRWDRVDELTEDLAYILYYDPQNAMARDYMLAAMMLTNRMAAFYEVLCRFWPRSEPLPELLQQALCMVRIQYGADRIAADGFTISPQVEADFRAYLQTHAAGRRARFTDAQKRTVWYYIHFLSPEGHSLIF